MSEILQKIVIRETKNKAILKQYWFFNVFFRNKLSEKGADLDFSRGGDFQKILSTFF